MHPAACPPSFVAQHLPDAWPFFAARGSLAIVVAVVFRHANGLWS